jgi:hypothetical protein
MGECQEVACEYGLINATIVGKMNHMARCINLNRMRETRARILLRSALSKGQVFICQNGNQYSEIFVYVIIDGSRFSMDNTLK